MISRIAREDILEEADKTFPLKIREKLLPKVRKLLTDMAYDKGIYELAELKYHFGPPENEKLFISAIADYLLRHGELLPTKP